MRRTLTFFIAAFLALGGFPALSAQSAGPTFDAALVKLNKENDGNRRAGFQAGGRFIGINVSVTMLISAAFGTPDTMWPGFQVTGGPDWLNKEGYDVETKADPGTPPELLRLMLRTLLIERFKLATHIESRDLPIYSLVLARNDGKLGPQLRPSAGDCIYGAVANPAGLPHCEDRFGPPRLKARRVNTAAATLDTLAARLQSQVGRRVVNRTGLTKKFDIDVEFNYVTPPLTAADQTAAEGLSIFAAMEDQLGLRLDSDHGPVDILVIDRAEHPTVD